MELENKIQVVRNLYNKALADLVEMETHLPSVKCIYASCGYTCCVEPKYTMLEFLRLFNSFSQHFTPEEIKEWFLSVMPVREDGIPRCRFQGEDKGCFIYPIRPFVCRVYGHKALDELTDENNPGTDKYRENCPPLAGQREGKETLDELIAFENKLREGNILLGCDIDKQRMFVWDWLLLTTKEKINPEEDHILMALAILAKHGITEKEIKEHINEIEGKYHSFDLMITNGIKSAISK